MPKVKPVYNPENILIGYSFFCPGCGHDHIYYTNPIGYEVTWTFNGNVNNPTFGPSLLNRTGIHATPKWNPEFEDGTDHTKPPYSTICHLFVQNGIINYCGDCTHDHNGKQGVPMKEYPE